MATSPVKSQPFQNLPLSFFKWGNPQNHHHRSDHHPSSEPPSVPIIGPPPETAAEKPWNLRPRRCSMNAAEKDLTVSKSMGLPRIGENQCVEKKMKKRGVKEEGEVPKSMMMMKKRGEKGGGFVEVTVPKSMRLRRIGEDQCVEKEMKLKRKVRLWISLSKEEIEEDVFGMSGSRSSRRPKRRSKIVQKQIDNLLPGLCLEGVSADEYRL